MSILSYCRILVSQVSWLQFFKLKLYDVSSTDEQELTAANNLFRRLVTLHIRLSLLSDVYTTAGFSHGRGAAVVLLPLLTGPGSSDIIPDLGALHRAFIWEHILFKTGLAAKGVSIGPASPTGTLSPSHASVNGDAENVPAAVAELQSSTTVGKEQLPKPEGPSEYNAKALKHMANQIPSSLTPLFQGRSLVSDVELLLLR